MADDKHSEQDKPFRRNSDGFFSLAGKLVAATAIGFVLLVLFVGWMLLRIKH